MNEFRMATDTNGIVDQYLLAKGIIIEKGYAEEIDWQTCVSFTKLTEADFLREASWVILSAGMSETVIRKHFPAISSAFENWEGAAVIVKHRRMCESAALAVFSHVGKITAILRLAIRVFEHGFEYIKERIRLNGVNYLQTFDYIGPVTSFHLAKNIGLDVVKPDRHLVRLASALGFLSPAELCHTISAVTGERVSVVDLVLWRFATIRADYTQWFHSTALDAET